MTDAVNQTRTMKVDGVIPAPWPWLFALRCLVCGEPGAAGRDLCAACHQDLPWQGPACLRCALPMPHPSTCGQCLQHAPPLGEAHAVFHYAFPLDRLLPRLKFQRDLAAGRVLAQAMAERCALWPQPDALLAVPLHRARLRQRGYDQALELAKPLARALQLPFLDRALHRRNATLAQSLLDAGARQRNLRGAFEVAKGQVLPAHVALLDDVMTTGATLHAAARVLLDAGVQQVDAWVCARVA